MSSGPKSKKSFPWDVVEKGIKKEMNWLRRAIDTFSDKEKGPGLGTHYCRECLLRKIAILIISGKIAATELTRKPPLKSFWQAQKRRKKGISHGEEWHSKTMGQIENHFIRQGYKVIREPTLRWGRADLEAYKKNKQSIIIEVGTTSLFKIWINLETMKRFTYLIVPSDDKLIEFICT